MSRVFVGASSQRITITGTAGITAEPYTIACWVKPTSSSGNQELVSMSADTSAWVILRQNSSAQIYAATNDGASNSGSTTSGTVTNGTWAHAAGVFTANNSRTAYLNGTAATVDTGARTVAMGAFNTQLSGLAGATEDMDGALAEVGIWKVALGADEITALANGAPPLFVRPDQLVAYWPLFGTDSPEPDWNPSGTVANGTLVNTPTQGDHAPVWPYLSFTGDTFPPISTYPAAYRRFFSPLGTREGTRQLQGWT